MMFLIQRLMKKGKLIFLNYRIANKKREKKTLEWKSFKKLSFRRDKFKL